MIALRLPHKLLPKLLLLLLPLPLLMLMLLLLLTIETVSYAFP